MRLKELSTQIVEFCYPTTCVVCAAPANDRAQQLCSECVPKLAEIQSAPACEYCAMPLGEHGAPCPYCRGKGVPHYERVVRLGVFRDPLKHLIHEMKYHRQWALAELLTDRLIAHEPAKGILAETEVVVPVPLHPLRHIVRSYNQAELIARRIARRCRIRFVDALVRLRRTEMQTHLHSAAQRAENLRDAFALLRRKPLVGKHVLVVDDVMTTGATLQSAARALEPAKPASLCALVIAIADPKHQDFQAI